MRTLEFGEEIVAELGQSFELVFGVDDQSVAWNDAFPLVKFDDHKAVGRGFGSDSDT